MKLKLAVASVLALGGVFAGCQTGGTGPSKATSAAPATRPTIIGNREVEGRQFPLLTKRQDDSDVVAPATRPVIIIEHEGPGRSFPLLNTRGDDTEAAKPAAGELLQPTTDMTGYGEESYRIVSRPDEIITVLKNGATVICKRVESPVVSVRGYAMTGGVYEGKWLGGGLSHLLEHLVAGGSNENRTEEENRDILQKIGNDSNAYTTTDHTAFFINTTTEHMASAVDLICNWMLTAKITEAEYRREYQVVQRELEMGKGEPDRVYYYMSAANRYRVSPTRVPVIGYQEVIQGLKRDDVYSYFKLAYVPNNLVFAVAGDLEPEKMLAAVQSQVKGAKPGRDFSHDLQGEPPVLAPRTVVATFPKLGQAKLQLAFPSVRLTDPDVYALDLLSTALGGGESSLLVEILRDEKQLVSAVGVADDTPAYVEGTFQVDMELEPAKIQEATKLTLELLDKVAKEGIDEERLARAKTQMRAAWVKKNQTAEDVASNLATDFIGTGDPHFGEHYAAQIDKVTSEQIKQVASKYFDRNKLLTTSLIPAEFTGAAGLPKAEELLRSTPSTTQPAAHAADSQITKIDLDDNTVLLLKRITTSPLVVTEMYSLGGLTAEDEKTNGIGNLTMQLLQRGTKTRNAQQIAQFWDSIGGEFDAACGTNSWTWSATCLKADFAKAYEAFADQVNNPTFPDAELPAMKKRIVAQIQGQDADWTNQAFRFFKKTYYGPIGSPYQFLPSGTQEGVEKFTADDVREWYESALTHKRVIAVFGDVDPKTAEALVRKMAIRKGQPKAAPKPAVLPVVVRPPLRELKTLGDVEVTKVAVNKTEQKLAGIVVGYEADTVIGDPRNFPIAVGDTMTSGYRYPTGYLFETLRGRGLVYVADAQNSPGRSKELPGTFLVYAGCEPSKVNEVIDVILENIARLQGTPEDVNEKWFARSKELIVVAEAMDNQTPAQQASQAAVDELFGLGYAWHQKFADNIRTVQLGQVRDIAKNKLRRCVVTVSTPQPESVQVKAGVREYTSFPKVELTPRGIQHDTGGK